MDAEDEVGDDTLLEATDGVDEDTLLEVMDEVEDDALLLPVLEETETLLPAEADDMSALLDKESSVTLTADM